MHSDSMSSSDEAQPVEAHSSVGDTYAERRKSSKPIMEKRRRARINKSLTELKSILLAALKREAPRHSKLEKADILEMTVNHLKKCERHRLSVSLSVDPHIVDKYRAGFSECRNEVMKFLSTCEGVTVDVRTRLLSHLATCLQSIQSQSNPYEESTLSMDNPPFPVPILQNGHNQPIRVRFPEPTAISPVHSHTATIAPKSTIVTAPVLEPQIAVLQSTPSRHYAAPIVLPEGTQLASTIGGLDGGNITVLVPQIGGTTFLTSLAAASHTVQTLPISTAVITDSTTNEKASNTSGKMAILTTKTKSPNNREILPKSPDKPNPYPESKMKEPSGISDSHRNNKRKTSGVDSKCVYSSETTTGGTYEEANSSPAKVTPPKKRRRTRTSPNNMKKGCPEIIVPCRSPTTSSASSIGIDVDDNVSDSSSLTNHVAVKDSGPWRPWSKPKLLGENS